MARHMQACLVLRQFEYILNVTEHINENYLRVKEKFLRAIDYVEDINVDQSTTNGSPSRHKRDSESPFDTRTTPEEIRYLTQLLSELAAWDPINNTTQRKKRFIPLFASIGAAIGSIVNAGQIKKIKKNIAILQEATILQDQQIMELARYADLTAARVRLHDTQIYRLQYGLLIVEDGLREMIDVSNFQVYTSYHVAIAQTILSRLQTGSVSIENNIDKIFEYLRIMSNRKATSAVIPPVALRRLLLRIEDRMTGAVVLPQSFSFISLRPNWAVSPGVVPRRVWRRWTRGGYPIVRVLLVVCKLTTLHLGRDDRGKENTVSPP